MSCDGKYKTCNLITRACMDSNFGTCYDVKCLKQESFLIFLINKQESFFLVSYYLIAPNNDVYSMKILHFMVLLFMYAFWYLLTMLPDTRRYF